MNISVISSVYRDEKADYLDEALHSIWDAQTIRPNEIVLIEDGPLTDELYTVLRKWKDSLGDRLLLHRNERNIGLTKSLNIAIRLSHGELLARMDTDDKAHPERFEKQHAYLMQHADIAVVGGSIQEFNADNPNLGVRRFPLSPESVCRYICKASPLAHPAVMMRKSIFDRLRYDERYRTSQDIALWYDVLCSGMKIANLDDIVLFFRRDGDVYKRRSRQKAWNEFRIYMGGICRYYGCLTWRYIYPLSRLAFRLMPVWIIKGVYDSILRKKLLSPGH